MSSVIISGGARIASAERPSSTLGARAWLEQSSVVAHADMSARAGSKEGSLSTDLDTSRQLLLAERGWVWRYLGAPKRARAEWERSSDPLARLGEWFVRFDELLARSGELRALGREGLDDELRAESRAEARAPNLRARPLTRSSVDEQASLVTSYMRLLTDVRALFNNDTPRPFVKLSQLSDALAQIPDQERSDGVSSVVRTPEELIWSASLVWSALVTLAARAPSALLGEVIERLESRWRTLALRALPDTSHLTTSPCRLASESISRHQSQSTQYRRYHCIVSAPSVSSDGYTIALTPLWSARRLRVQYQGEFIHELTPPTRGELWWLTELNFDRLTARLTHLGHLKSREPHQSRSAQPASHHALTLEIEALRPPQVTWLLTPPALPARVKRHAPSVLLDLWRDVTDALKRGHLSSIYTESPGWEPRVPNLAQRWPRVSPPCSRFPCSAQSPVQRHSIRQDDPRVVALVTRIHLLAHQRGADIAARALSRLLRHVHITTPKRWLTLLKPRSADQALDQFVDDSTRVALGLNEARRSTHIRDDLRWLLADLLIAANHERRLVIPPLLTLDPSSSRAVRWLVARPEWSPVVQARALFTRRLKLDAEALISAHKIDPWPSLRRGNMGQLLDHQTLYLLPDGSGVRWVTEVIRINSKRGVEDFGEIKLPEGARLIELYQRKQRGGYRAPLELLETGGYSLSDLQIGDYLIARYIEPISSERHTTSVLTPPIPLIDATRAVELKVVEVYSARPRGDKGRDSIAWITPRSAVSADDYQVESARREDLIATRVTVRRAQPYKHEPESPSLMLSGPTLRVGAPLNPNAERREVSLYLQRALTSEVGLCERATALLGERERPSVPALAQIVRSRIQREEALFDAARPARALTRGVGHRGVTLSALMSACGYSHEVWLARPMMAHHHPPTETLEGFNHLLLRWEGLWIDPDLIGAPLGLVSRDYAGGAATRVWPLNDSTLTPASHMATLVQESLPWYGAFVPNERAASSPALLTHHARGALSVDPDRPLGVLSAHAVTGSMTHTFTGAEGHLIYTQMSSASTRALGAWVERQWEPWWGPTEVKRPRVTYERGAAVLRYDLLVWARPQRDLSLSPQTWGQRFASLDTRTQTLILPFTQQVVELDLTGIEVLSVSDSTSVTLPTLATRARDQSGERAQASGDEVQVYTPTLWVEAPAADHPRALHASFSRHISVRAQVAPETAPEVTPETAPEVTPKTASENPLKTRIKLTWSLTGGALGAQRYQSWKRFARDVDQLERLQVRIKSKK